MSGLEGTLPIGWSEKLATALARLPGPEAERYVQLFAHGSLKVLVYAPQKADPQPPHVQDEVYVIVRGSGNFRLGESAFSFSEGDAIFVPAQVAHRFEDFSDDLAVWVVLYGPAGGERVDPPKSTLKIDTREELINALQEAIHVEHGLMVQYLFAAISCKRSPAEDLTEDEAELVRQWEGIILRVARDEMAHLATACNLITAVGGSPDFNRPNFPQARSRWFPFEFQLERLGPESLARFVRAESPKQPEPMVLELAPEPIEFDYVGELYGLIRSGFRELAKDERGRLTSAAEQGLIIGRPEAQDASDWSGGLRVSPIRSLQSAEAAIDFIVQQGEGTDAGREGSHFDLFSKMAHQLAGAIEKNPTFSPSRNVLKNPLTRPHRDTVSGYNLIDRTVVAAPVAELFNHLYGTMLLMLMQFFDPAGETDEQRIRIRDCARRCMSGVIRPLGEILTQLPATKDARGPTAGPSFELYGLLKIAANPRARFVILQERFTAAIDETNRLIALKEPSLLRLPFLLKNIELARQSVF